MATEQQEAVSDFVIAEQGGDRRRLVLRRRALPYRPFRLEGTQRVAVTWYPGSPIATAQVLGSEEAPTTITGMWKERFIVEYVDERTQQLVPADAIVDAGGFSTVMDLVAEVDDIRRKGQLLHVDWSNTRRAGFMTKFAQVWLNARDCEWEMEFTWISQQDEVFKNQLQQREVDLPAVAKRQRAAADDLLSTTNRPVTKLLDPSAVSARPALSVPNALRDGIANIQAATEAVENAVSNVSDGFMSGFEASRKAASALDFTVSESEAFIGAIYAEVDLALHVTDITAATLGQALSAALFNRRAVSRSRFIKHQSARERAKLLRSVDPELARVFFARQDQDLREVSTAFFGTPTEWGNIARFNGLRTSRLTAGQLILVPRTFGDRGTC